MPNYLLDIEKYLAHQIEACYETGEIPGPFWEKALDPFVTRDKHKMLSNPSYFMLDFNDFIDYSTSDLPGELDISDFSQNHVYFYDALPGTYNEGLFESGIAGTNFSIVGAAVARRGKECSIFLQLRLIGLEDLPLHEEVIYDKRTRDLFSKNHIFPYHFFYLSLTKGTNTDTLGETLRCLITPPIILGGPLDYGLSVKVYDNSIIESYKEKYGADSDLIDPAHMEIFSVWIDRCNTEFEIARLILHLSKYYDFMYDLVIDERKRVGTKQIIGRAKRKKKTKGKPIYKIIKSIRISYAAEEETRKKLNAPRRTWTAPPYSFAVRGHWRKFKNSWWKGYDSQGNEVLGKTWVHEYEKGKDKEKQLYGTDERDPKVVIKLKQTLSYARDVIQAHELAKSQQIESFFIKETQHINEKLTKTAPISPVQDKNRPSEEWMYEERIKLTSGLRYIILKRDNFKCTHCGRGPEDGVKLEVDHKIPISEWGRTEESNLETLCRPCNQGKGSTL